MTDKIEQLNLEVHPKWIRGRVSWSEDFDKVRDLLSELSLNSVCLSAACPNRGECWRKGHVTFMILGDNCTRACRFCNVTKNPPAECDPSEPERVARAVHELGLKYVVITSVTRDDLPDKGSEQFIKTVTEVKKSSPDAIVELLIPDMDADEGLLEGIANSGADVVGHNIEMPEALYPEVRPRSDYENSIRTINILKENAAGVPIKSSIILGLGETEKDINRTLKDMKVAGADILYIGQYLSPSKKHWPVKKYYFPAEFQLLGEKGREVGFKVVLSGAMVRSSYRAYESYLKYKNRILN